MQRGLRNTMITMGMLDGPLDLPDPMFAVGGEHLIHSPVDGLFVPLKALEQVVRRGERMGYVLDVETGVRTDIVSPANGAVWLNARNGPKADVVLQGLQAYATRGDLLALIKEIRSL